MQLVQLRDNYSKYQELGISVVVIAGQKMETVSTWLKENPMPFLFLIDRDREVIKAFDVYNPINIDAFRIAHPSLFLITEEGKIVYSYVGKNQRDRPTDEQTFEEVHKLLSETIQEEFN